MKDLLEIDGARLWQSLADMARVGATPRAAPRAHRRRSSRARPVRAVVPRRGNDGECRRRRQPVRAARRHRCAGSAGADRQPPRHAARRRPLRWRLWRARRARTRAHAERRRHRDRQAAGDRVLDQREGARFAPAMLGSAVFTGALPLDEALAKQDADGVTLGAALDACGYRGTRTMERRG